MPGGYRASLKRIERDAVRKRKPNQIKATGGRRKDTVMYR